jgi:hypothetical protein
METYARAKSAEQQYQKHSFYVQAANSSVLTNFGMSWKQVAKWMEKQSAKDRRAKDDRKNTKLSPSQEHQTCEEVRQRCPDSARFAVSQRQQWEVSSHNAAHERQVTLKQTGKQGLAVIKIEPAVSPSNSTFSQSEIVDSSITPNSSSQSRPGHSNGKKGTQQPSSYSKACTTQLSGETFRTVGFVVAAQVPDPDPYAVATQISTGDISIAGPSCSMSLLIERANPEAEATVPVPVLHHLCKQDAAASFGNPPTPTPTLLRPLLLAKGGHGVHISDDSPRTQTAEALAGFSLSDAPSPARETHSTVDHQNTTELLPAPDSGHEHNEHNGHGLVSQPPQPLPPMIVGSSENENEDAFDWIASQVQNPFSLM